MQQDRRHPELYRAVWVMVVLVTVAAAIAMSTTDGSPASLHPDGAGDLG
jgi:hypothetical protein